jgi:integrase
MPKLLNRHPKLCHEKNSNQAVVRIDGKKIYLGRWGLPETQQNYDRVIGEWLANGRSLRSGQNGSPDLTVNELLSKFWDFAETYYVKNGKPTDEQACIKSAMRPLKQLYGDSAANDFGPLALKAVREQMVENKWTRKFVNGSVERIRRVFRWGAENELVPVAVHQALMTVAGLRRGKTKARESAPRHPVAAPHVNAVKKLVPQKVRDLIDLQLLSGARPGELIELSPDVIDKRKSVWTAQLDGHKTEHFGKTRILFFGPRAQTILRKYLKANHGAKLFDIDRDRYRRIVSKACRDAGIKRWTPHWLRHSAGTKIRETFGPEAAQILLGHAQLSSTEIYAQRNVRLAMRVARKVG